LNRLRERIGDRVEYLITDKYNWATIGMADAVFLQRPYKEDHLMIVEMAKNSRKRVWVDYDDDLMSVPHHNPCHNLYGNEETKRTIQRIAAAADVVTTSTPALSSRFDKYNKNVVTIPNAIDDKLFARPAHLPPPIPLVVWRGSQTHDKDLWAYGDGIKNASSRCQKATFSFIGRPFWGVIESLEHQRTVVVDSLDPVEYHSLLTRLTPTAMMVPLFKDSFNLAKSNIAWIEACYAGAVAVAPDWPEWKLPGCVNYKDQKEFAQAIVDAIEEPKIARRQADEGWEYIKENLTLGTVNGIRASVIMDLMG